MTKTIDTLVDDIYEVITSKGGWTETVNEYFKGRLGSTMMSRLSPPEKEYKPSIRMSNVGQPCARKLWYYVNESGEGEPLPPQAHLKFLYGDILEDLLLSLATAAGHRVEGEQDVMEINGIKGHRDCVIDGVLIDVKSASAYSFQKFKENRLREDDAFGYIGQLSSYLYASQDDPLVEEKDKAGFLVIDKVSGSLCLDMYDLRTDMARKEQMIEERKEIVNASTPPPRGFQPEADGYWKGRKVDGDFRPNGSKKLGTNCSYCDFKHVCHPGLRTFVSARGPVYFTDLKHKPRMMEVTDED